MNPNIEKQGISEGVEHGIRLGASESPKKLPAVIRQRVRVE